MFSTSCMCCDRVHKLPSSTEQQWEGGVYDLVLISFTLYGHCTVLYVVLRVRLTGTQVSEFQGRSCAQTEVRPTCDMIAMRLATSTLTFWKLYSTVFLLFEYMSCRIVRNCTQIEK